ncbi:MAG TPA: hypothetical protein VFO59_04615, partial [Dehalococcoidia bacterium]|nr:hypothetical protein [Dehalococcoidia bacterium]
MAKRRDIFEDDDGISGMGAPDIADPEPSTFRRAAESAVPEVDVREPTEPSERGIYTQEGMIEDARRAQRPAEKSLAELVASVMANPVAEDEPANEPEAAEVHDEFVEAVVAGGIPDDDEAEPRRIRVFALLGVAVIFIAAAAFLLTRGGGGSDTGPGAAGEPPGDAVSAQPDGAGVPPADGQVATEPTPAPETVAVIAP